MTGKQQKIVLIGAGEFAQIAYEYFTHDSPYEVVAFSVEKDYIETDTLCGLPVVPFETLEQHYPPSTHAAYVAVTYPQLNRVRARLFDAAKKKGYACANYISSRAFVWHNVKLGENIFIFEHNTVQPFCEIEDNVVLWSGNHIGHRTIIRRNVYMASHVVVSGYCDIGENSFIGVNATFADHVKLGRDCFVTMACGVTKSTDDNLVLKGMPAQPAKITAMQYMKVNGE